MHSPTSPLRTQLASPDPIALPESQPIRNWQANKDYIGGDSKTCRRHIQSTGAGRWIHGPVVIIASQLFSSGQQAEISLKNMRKV